MGTQFREGVVNKKEIEILAGDDGEAIATAIMKDITQTFCVEPCEFKSEYPGELPVKYRVEVLVTRLD